MKTAVTHKGTSCLFISRTIYYFDPGVTAESTIYAEGLQIMENSLTNLLATAGSELS